MVAIDYTDFYSDIFSVYGVSATLLVDTTSYSITVIDRTKGITVMDRPGVETVYPVARVRMSELTSNAIALQDIDGGSLTFHGATWRIERHRVNANSRGELNGTVDLILLDEGSSV